MQLLPFLLLAPSCGDDGLTVPAPSALRSADDSGIFAWVADGVGLGEAASAQAAPGRLQWRVDGGAWHHAWGPAGQALSEGTRYWLPVAALGDPDLAAVELRVVVGDVASPAVTASHAALTLTLGSQSSGPDSSGPQSTPLSTPLIGSDLLQPALASSLGDLSAASGAVEVQVDWVDAQGAGTAWLDTACAGGAVLVDCLSDTALRVPVVDVATLPVLPALVARHAEPLTLQLRAFLWLDAVSPDGTPMQGLLSLAAPSVVVPSMGRELYWGDLNAKSNLSPTGCELPDQACDHRGAGAGQDFFDNARAAGLDFVALTDQAEWGGYYPDGLDGDFVDIWSEQQRLAGLGDGGDLVALVGYEWTSSRDQPDEKSADDYYADPYEGGYKTVLFQSLSVPEAFRIGGTVPAPYVTKGEAAVYTAGTNPQTDQVAELYDLLQDAAGQVGQTPVLSYFHHPAYQWPQGVDFSNPLSAPDVRVERLVEIYSELGSSECIDPTNGDCEFQVDLDHGRYLPRGSVQQALFLGYRLGFVAGTDSKDARPGSVGDGPSYLGDPDAPAETAPEAQFTAGGLTGALVAGPLDRQGLFTALTQRATVATTGPRPEIRVLALDASGRPWLPGQVIPADAGPLRVLAQVSGEGYGTERVSLVQGSGAIAATADGDSLDASVELTPASAWYVRAVLRGGETTSDQEAEHRVWISPFFTESAE